jgi:hypothetical protein
MLTNVRKKRESLCHRLTVTECLISFKRETLCTNWNFNIYIYIYAWLKEHEQVEQAG